MGDWIDEVVKESDWQDDYSGRVASTLVPLAARFMLKLGEQLRADALRLKDKLGDKIGEIKVSQIDGGVIKISKVNSPPSYVNPSLGLKS